MNCAKCGEILMTGNTKSYPQEKWDEFVKKAEEMDTPILCDGCRFENKWDHIKEEGGAMKSLLILLIASLVITNVVYAEVPIDKINNDIKVKGIVQTENVTAEQVLNYQYWYCMVVTEDGVSPTGVYGIIVDIIEAKGVKFVVLATRYIDRDLMFIKLDSICYVKAIKYYGGAQ